jgi:hypothetical protein
MQKVEGSNPFSRFADQALESLRVSLDGLAHCGPAEGFSSRVPIGMSKGPAPSVPCSLFAVTAAASTP